MKASVTTDGKRILARIDYANGRGRDAAKRVPGARPEWDRTVTPNVFKYWSYPLTMDTCRAFRKVFGDELTVLPVLAKWAQEEVGRERSLETLRAEAIDSVDLSRVELEAPALYAALKNRRYQISGVGFILTGRTVVLGDDPGLGKTLQGLAAVIQDGAQRILVACRRTATRAVWERETARWAPGITTFVAQGSATERKAVIAAYAEFDGQKMLIINIEMMRAKRQEVCLSKEDVCPQILNRECRHRIDAIPLWPFLSETEWDAIIIDECHNALASTKNVQSKSITQWRFGAMQIRRRLRANGLAIAMSGTPFRSKLEKAWGTLNWLAPESFGSFWRWAGQYFGVEQGRYGKVIGGGAKVLEPRDADAWQRMLRPWYLKRTKKDAAPDLPDIIFAGTPVAEGEDSPCYVQIEMDPVQAKLYWEMEAEAEAHTPTGRITATGVLAEITRLRQFANASGIVGEGRSVSPALPSGKIEWLIDFVNEREDTGVKVVIASSFSEMVELAATVLRKECGVEVLTLTGETSDKDRARLVERFQDPDDSLRVVILNRNAGGESITLDRADDMVVIDQPWISDTDEQLIARIHRVSRIHQVTVYRLLSSGTIDEWMASLTDEQREVIKGASPEALAEYAIAGSK
jgi:SNF2 family DNA or RNA helicase